VTTGGTVWIRVTVTGCELHFVSLSVATTVYWPAARPSCSGPVKSGAAFTVAPRYQSNRYPDTAPSTIADTLPELASEHSRSTCVVLTTGSTEWSSSV